MCGRERPSRPIMQGESGTGKVSKERAKEGLIEYQCDVIA